MIKVHYAINHFLYCRIVVANFNKINYTIMKCGENIKNFRFSYMVPVITISHIGITSSSFLILAATFERYCITVTSKYVHFAQRNRKKIAVFAILMGVISKGTMCLEFKVYYSITHEIFLFRIFKSTFYN